MRNLKIARIFLISIFSMALLTLTACGSSNYKTNIHEVNEDFHSIFIKTDTADIAFVLSDDEMCKVVCYEEEKNSHFVGVENDTLTINLLNDKNWYDYVGINFANPKITVYLSESKYFSLVIEESTGDIEIPKDLEFKNIDISLSTGDVMCYASALEDIKITTSTGDISLESIRAASLNLCVSTGRVTISDVTCEKDITIKLSTGKTYLTDTVCQNLISHGSTGDISLKNVISKEKISIERSTGDVTFIDSDAAELFIMTDTGDVEGSLLTNKVFIIQSDTGNIDVPESITGGRCEITTDTGDIKISFSNN